MASSVCKNFFLTITKELVKQDKDRMEQANGYSVQMFNEYVGMFGIGATAPGYITLGQAWAYGDVTNVGKPEDTSDGGAYGGVEFTSRPDSLSFYVKRTHAQEPPKEGAFNKEERATVVFYTWTGSSTSKVMTGMSNAPVEMDMVDREKDILGKIKDGVSGDAKLIASNEYYIEGEVEDWTRHSFAVRYESDENPEKMNLIFSASDYFDRSALGTGNTLSVDDVRLIYNARLKSLKINGEMVANFDDAVFSYQLPAVDGDVKVEAEAFGKDAKVEVTNESNVYTVKVTDDTAKGEKTNSYTVVLKGVKTAIVLPETAPSLTYGDELEGLGFTSNSTMPFIYSISDENVLKQGEDGKLRAVGTGEVIVTAAQEGNDDFTPAVSEQFTVTVAKAPVTVSLTPDSWCWRGVNVSSYNMDSGKCSYDFTFDGLKWDDAEKSSEEIFTVLPTVSATAPTDTELPGSTRVVTFKNGEAANYDITYAEEVKINVVKNEVGAYVRYGNGTLSTAYSGENYRTLKVAEGQDEYYFTVEYTGTVYDDAEQLKQVAAPTVVCTVNKEAKIGDIFPVSLEMPEALFDNFDFVNIVPEEAKVVIAANPNIKVSVPEVVTYGDEFQLLSNESGITSYGFKNMPSAVLSVSSRGLATAKGAGEAEFVVTTNVNTTDGVEYGITTTRVKFDVAKAPLVLTAQDVEMTTDDALPESFEIAYEGFVGKDNIDNVFETAPVAEAEVPAVLVKGEYPIKVTVSEAPANYEVKVVDGVLTVTGGDGVNAVVSDNGKVSYAGGNLYVPCGGTVEVYALTGALVGRYNGTVIPVSLKANAMYIVKTLQGAYRVWVK